MDETGDKVSAYRDCRCRRGVAMIMAMTVSVVLFALVAAIYLVTVQRHTLMRKRAAHTGALYLAEAGMHDAIARLRIGNTHPSGIDPAVGDSYCLDISAIPALISASGINCTVNPFPCAATEVCVQVSNNLNPNNRNQIDVRTEF
ncbi:MAG: hypothetical protein ABH845_04095 [Candidatus Omnitrophota bacterium]